MTPKMLSATTWRPRPNRQPKKPAMFLVFNYKQAVLSEDVEQPTAPGGLTQTDEKVHHSTLRSADSWRWPWAAGSQDRWTGPTHGGPGLGVGLCLQLSGNRLSQEESDPRWGLRTARVIEDTAEQEDDNRCREGWEPRGNHSNTGRRSKGRMKTEPRKRLPSTPNHLTIIFLKLQEASTYRIYWKETWRNKCVTKEVYLRSI